MATGVASTEIARAGIPPAAAKWLLGDVDAAVTAVGTDETDGYQIVKKWTLITGGSSKVVVLPTPAQAGEWYGIVNDSANTNTIYPPSGVTINGTTTLSIADNKSCICFAVSATSYYSIPFAPT